MAKALFWNINFIVIYSTVKKIVHSIGSENLIGIAEKVCDERNTPASHLVKHGILMWYKKNVRIEEIAAEFNKPDFPETAKRVMKYQIVNHCSMHSINYKDKQRISDEISISARGVEKQIAKLREEGRLKRIGPDKGGHWEVIDE